MALGGKREVTVHARAFVDVTGHATAFDVIGVATIGQVRNLVGHSLFEEVFGIFPVQLWIEAQQVLVQMRDTGFLPAQLEAHHGAFERSFEKGFG
jgi:hypothetical protein